MPALPEPVARGGEMSPRGRSPRGASPLRQVVAQEELDDVSTEAAVCSRQYAIGHRS